MRTYYDDLNVSPESEGEVIQAAFRALSKKYHPDRDPSDGSRMKLLNEAYAVLGNPKSRAEYDAKLLAKAARTAEARASSGDEHRATESETRKRPVIDLEFGVDFTERRQNLVYEFRNFSGILWFLVPCAAAYGATYNFGRQTSGYSALVALTILISFVFWKPTASAFKTMMLSSAKRIAEWLAICCGAYVIGTFIYVLLTGELKKNGMASLSSSVTIFCVTTFAVALALVKLIHVAVDRDTERMLNLLTETGDYDFMPLNLQ